MLPNSPRLLYLLHLIAVAPLTLSAPPLDPTGTVPDCGCYRATGDKDALFVGHQFYDFRNLNNETVGSDLSPPPLINASQDRGIEPITSPFFDKAIFGGYFTAANWLKNASEDAPISMVNSQQNVYLDSPTHLTLRTNRLPNFQSTSNIESIENDYFHASIRIRARVNGAAGACAGMFTYFSDKQESDIEILTRDGHSTMRATNQPGVDMEGKVIPEASTQATVTGDSNGANGSWTEWNEYQLDWLPGHSEWFVNGVSNTNKSYGVPTEPSNFQIKMWSDGSAWTGNMTVGGVATLDIEWIDLVYNRSSDKAEQPCKTVCKIDNIANDPTPKVASAATGTSVQMGTVLSLIVTAFWMATALLA
ncbi:MAG: hypothetical protein Q9214_004743 [Letrouitia sp. 1 TL-2023]